MYWNIIESAGPVWRWLGGEAGPGEMLLFTTRGDGHLVVAEHKSTRSAGLRFWNVVRGHVTGVQRIRLGPHHFTFELTLPSRDSENSFHVDVILTFMVSDPVQVLRTVQDSKAFQNAIRKSFSQRAQVLSEQHGLTDIDQLQHELNGALQQSTLLPDIGIVYGSGETIVRVSTPLTNTLEELRHELLIEDVRQALEWKRMSFYRRVLDKDEEDIVALLLIRHPERIVEFLSSRAPTIRATAAASSAAGPMDDLSSLFANLSQFERHTARKAVVDALANTGNTDALNRLHEAFEESDDTEGDGIGEEEPEEEGPAQAAS